MALRTVKWDKECDCTMMVLDAKYDEMRVMYLTKCKTHKSDKTTRRVYVTEIREMS